MYYGADIGRGAVKIVSRIGQVVFPSYLVPARERDLVSATDGVNFYEQLTVMVNGQEYFVGELARREGGTREFAKQKHEHENTLPLLVTGIALATRDDYVAPKVVIGLPISDYRSQARSFEQAMLGYYDVSLPHKRVRIELTAGQVIAFPEGAGALWSLLLNPDGIPLDTPLAEQTVAVVDVGWKTCNVVVLRKLLYEDALSTTFPLGLSRAFSWYYKRISREVDILPAQAESRMRKDGAPELQRLARELSDQLASWWPHQGEIDAVYLAGGGGKALSPYLHQGLKIMPNAQLANAAGFYRVARAKL